MKVGKVMIKVKGMIVSGWMGKSEGGDNGDEIRISRECYVADLLRKLLPLFYLPLVALPQGK
jgi:hypothetical protein